MLSVSESPTLAEAGQDLVRYILEPAHWVSLDGARSAPDKVPGKNPEYQRAVGMLRICASVDVTQDLGVFLRVGFRAPGLTPARAADHLEEFLKSSLPLRPNTEWQVQVDARRWIHFIRRLVGEALVA